MTTIIKYAIGMIACLKIFPGRRGNSFGNLQLQSAEKIGNSLSTYKLGAALACEVDTVIYPKTCQR